MGKWQENKIIKVLYEKNIRSVANPNNRELAKEYEILRRKFYKAYDIDKIEKLLMASNEIEKLKNDNIVITKKNRKISIITEIIGKIIKIVLYIVICILLTIRTTVLINSELREQLIQKLKIYKM